MKLFLLLTLLPTMLCAQVKAPAWVSSLTKSAPGSFAPLKPCRVVYDLSWNNLISAGSAKVVMQEAGGHQVARAEAGTTGLARALWSYDCTMISVMDRGPLRAVHLNHTETDVSETVAYEVGFSPLKVLTETVLTPKGGTVKKSSTICPYGPVDDLQSAILYVRSQPLKQGDKITRVVQPFDRPYLTTFTVVNRGKRKVEGTVYPVIELDVKIRKIDAKTLVLGSFKKVKTATIWVSDDTWRLPIEMHADIFVGFISATMTKREALTGKAAQGSLPTGFSKKVR